MDHYVLPCHPAQTCLDPLGLCDDENPFVWAVVTACLQGCSDISQLPRVVEDLSYSIHMQGDQDTRFLRQFLLERYPDPQSPAAKLDLQNILSSALQLPSLFPAHVIPYLSPSSDPVLHLSHAQIRSLLSHQILNTLSPPPGNTWGCTFTCWYSEPQPLKTAIMGYLSALFDYFELPLDEDDTTKIEYRYITTPAPSLGCMPVYDIETWKRLPTSDVLSHLRIEPTTSATVPFLNAHDIPCTLIASNKEPGFGPSCTQEELVTAACPPLLILGALLVSPPIPPDAALLVSGIVPLSHWRGQGREARLVGKTTLEQHTFLLLDASELDAVDIDNPTTPSPIDLHPPYLLRDLVKCQLGFSALRQRGVKEISAPLWGAGAFGGDPVVKCLVLAMAACREDVVVTLSVDQDRVYSTAKLGETLDVAHGNNHLGTVVSVLEGLQTKYRGSSDVNMGELFATLYPQGK
ncbi:hypothetical protein D9619_003443 [Psilocybe cf. subviscida]|uniref:poly(ADP-ribose) glycohydrolase n=1 Tax=Psilocybe cf. subviscida TaxID=2480587 RepID=A0A8H5AYA4_9AGAR|nr:hypothetical protein D9619_003443 [Psilocybe cf. subviscida]